MIFLTFSKKNLQVFQTSSESQNSYPGEDSMKNAVFFYRELMGNTDPSKADAGTIRKLYGSNIQCNAVHGSDSEETASKEISFFFSKLELFD